MLDRINRVFGWTPVKAAFQWYLHQGRRTVRAGQQDDFEAMVRVLAEGLAPTAFGEWLIADPDQRRAVFPQYMAIIVADCLTRGAPQVIDEDGKVAAVALWFPNFDPTAGPEHYETHLKDACGPHTDRFEQLDKQLEQTHPPGRQDFLAFIAVDPRRRNRGLGSTLLRTHLRDLDRIGRAAVLDSSDPDNLRLYMRLGWVPDDTQYLPDDGPPYWPCTRPGR